MNFDEETLIEIEDYIQALDEQVGLKPETILDINRAITKQWKLVKNINYDTVLDAVCCPKCGKDEVETNSKGNWCINCNHKWGN